jgi:hypothetical protein
LLRWWVSFLVPSRGRSMSCTQPSTRPAPPTLSLVDRPLASSPRTTPAMAALESQASLPPARMPTTSCKLAFPRPRQGSVSVYNAILNYVVYCSLVLINTSNYRNKQRKNSRRHDGEKVKQEAEIPGSIEYRIYITKRCFVIDAP